MTREWFTANEIAGKTDMPTTARRVRTRAQSEGWQSRKRTTGKGFEYHLSSLPAETRSELVNSENSGSLQKAIWSAKKAAEKLDYFQREVSRAGSALNSIGYHLRMIEREEKIFLEAVRNLTDQKDADL